MIKIPDLTLVMIETREHKLAQLALKDCVDKVEFVDVLIYSDKFDDFNIPGAHLHTVEDWPDKEGWARFLWHGIANHVKTSHTLLIQWDSWVLDETAWKPEFLNYDYVGAPWWYKDGMNVGNSGFSIRSKALIDFLDQNREYFPVTTSAEDDLLCRKYRPHLPQFKWAPEKVAYDFAFERTMIDPKDRHFGFHGTFNWPFVLGPEQLKERLLIAKDSPYLAKSGMLAELKEILDTGKMKWLELDLDSTEQKEGNAS